MGEQLEWQGVGEEVEEVKLWESAGPIALSSVRTHVQNTSVSSRSQSTS